MLELRLRADAKRIASMRSAISRECRRASVDPEHAYKVALVAEQLVLPGDADSGRARRGRAPDVLVLVTVQSAETMLMVREMRGERGELGARRQRILEEHTSRWSTVSAGDGRTIWAEIARPAVRKPAPAEPVAAPEAPAPTAPVETVTINRDETPAGRVLVTSE